MPEELSGEIAQTRKLLNQFSDNLSPNPFLAVSKTSSSSLPRREHD